MIGKLYNALKKIQIDPALMELADMLWLSNQISPSVPKDSFSPKQHKYFKDKDRPLPDKKQSLKTQEKKIKAFPQTGKKTELISADGFSVKIPSAPMLPGKRNLEKALRPFMRRIASRTRQVLDADATVDQIAETGIWLPVLKPGLERWFDVALVIDNSPSMVIWQPTIAEFRKMIENHGAFRNVRSWSLTEEFGTIKLHSGLFPLPHSRLCHPKDIIAPVKPRIIFVLTDGIAPFWYRNTIVEYLELWGRKNIAAIVQMLPQRMWDESVLDESVRIKVQSYESITNNLKLIPFDSVDRWIEKNADEKGVKFPVLNLERKSFSVWSDTIVGKNCNWINSYLFEKNKQEQIYEDMQEIDLAAEERILYFQETASEKAQRLAAYFASVPLTLPVMRLIQQVMLPESGQAELAEVFLGGILKRISKDENNPNLIQYDFHEGVRKLLLDTVPETESLQVLKAVSGYIKDRFGQSLDFDAWLSDPDSGENIKIDEALRPFAEISANVLRRFGRRYEALIRQLEQKNQSENKIIEMVLEESVIIRDTFSSIQNTNKFTEFVCNFKPSKPLPLIHMTDAFHYRNILKKELLEPEQCNIFHEKLLYLFYGRPAYRVNPGMKPTVSASYPVGIILYPDAVKSAKRVFPFDTGCYTNNLFTDYMYKKNSINSFLVDPHPETPEHIQIPDTPAKIVSAFFENNNNYYYKNNRRYLSDIDSSFDFEAKCYYELIKTKTKTQIDDRCSSIEIQLSEPVILSKDSVWAVVLPQSFLENELIRNTVLKLWDAEPITYPSFRSEPDFFIPIIIDRVGQFLSNEGLI